ncbi:MAG: HDOD domain-containing protein [Gammaproteobacteria bacterium]|nr:HDOD domain-containing protein [Gammaproteobacteria bacterium]
MMNIPSTVRTFLANSRLRFKGRQIASADSPADSFEAIVALAGVPLSRVVKPVLVKAGGARLMVVIRADQELDLASLKELFKRDFTLCSEGEVRELLPNCDLQALPPLAEPYGLRSVVDAAVAEMPSLYFATGTASLLIATSGAEFVGKLHEAGWKGRSLVKGGSSDSSVVASPGEAMRKKVQAVNELPAMPGLAAEIIRIRNNPYANASELTAVIEQDPSLSAQVIRYAGSPLYAYQGKINSVEQAIVRVLGMDFVEDLAFGLSLGKAFKNPKTGPLGLDNFWQHALYCAALTQALCNQIDYAVRPPASVGYLAGLLHNFGILLLGHLFPAQFERLNKAVAAEPQRSLLELERETIAVSHTELGLWLMDAWDMPKEIAEAVSEHHRADHRGDYAVYANLIYIANALLKRHGIGDAPSMGIPPALQQRYGLDDEKLELALANVLQGREGLEFMAAKMAA